MTKKVIIVDDDKVSIKLLSAIIESDDSFVITATSDNGQDAIDQAAEHKPDYLCLDVNMPGMTGTEAIPGVKAASPDTKIIMISGCATMNLVKKSLDAGAQDFIIKPFDFEKVMAILSK